MTILQLSLLLLLLLLLLSLLRSRLQMSGVEFSLKFVTPIFRPFWC